MSAKFQPDVIANKDVIFFFSFLFHIHRNQIKNLCTSSRFTLGICKCPPFAFLIIFVMRAKMMGK